MPQDALHDNNGWDEWKRYVLGDLKRMSKDQSDMREANDTQHIAILNNISDLKADISALKVKAGIWGLMAGAIPVGIALLVQVFRDIVH